MIKQNNQSCFCYCPNCNNELCGTNSFVSDVSRIVTYECSKCGEVLQFDFEIAPVPILIGKKGIWPWKKLKNSPLSIILMEN